MRPLNDIMMHEGGAAVAGVGLRAAWSRGPMWGYIGTAAVVVGGLLADQFVRSPSSRRALEGVAAGGAAIAGWVAAEKLIFKGGSAPIPSRLMQRYQEALHHNQLRALAPGAGVPFPVQDPLLARNY